MNVREGPPGLAAGGPSTQAQGRVCPPRPGPKGNMSDSRLMMAKVSTERLRRDGFRRRPYVSNLSCLADRAERRGAGRRSLSLQRAPAVEPPTLTALFFPMSRSQYLRADRRRDPFVWFVEQDLCPLAALGLGRAQFLAGPLVDSEPSACPLVCHVCRPCPGGLPNRFLLAFYAPVTSKRKKAPAQLGSEASRG